MSTSAGSVRGKDCRFRTASWLILGAAAPNLLDLVDSLMVMVLGPVSETRFNTYLFSGCLNASCNCIHGILYGCRFPLVKFLWLLKGVSILALILVISIYAGAALFRFSRSLITAAKGLALLLSWLAVEISYAYYGSLGTKIGYAGCGEPLPSQCDSPAVLVFRIAPYMVCILVAIATVWIGEARNSNNRSSKLRL